MSVRLDSLRAAIRTLAEALPTKETPPEERAAFAERAKEAGKGRVRYIVPGGKQRLKPETMATKRGSAAIPSERLTKFAQALGARTGVGGEPEEPSVVGPRVLKRLRKAAHSPGQRSTLPATKPKAAEPRKASSPTSRRRRRRAHGAGGPGAGAGEGRIAPLGRWGEPHDPQIDRPGARRQSNEAVMSNYVPRTLLAGGSLVEAVLLEKKGKHARRKASQLAAAFPASGGDPDAPSPPPSAPSPSGAKKKKDWRQLRREGKIKGHKEKKEDGKSKYENPTTFKPCDKGAMISSETLRFELPPGIFVNDDPDWPTWPIRSNCRASLAALGRALQMAGPRVKRGDKLVRGPTRNQDIIKQVIGRVNQDTGEITGKGRLKLWGTGVRGARETTFRGPPGKPKRHPSYGSSTGERDERLHTDSSEHGKRLNRPAPHAGHFRKPEAEKKETKGARKRQERKRLSSIARAKRTIGLPVPGHAGLKPQPKGRGAAEAEKFRARAQAGKTTGKGRKKKRKKH